MNVKVLKTTAIALFLAAGFYSCTKETPLMSVITMESDSDNGFGNGFLMRFRVAGTGAGRIDWGDGTPVDTFTLTPIPSGDFLANYFGHEYSEPSIYTITIIGESITDLITCTSKIKSLDVSKCKTLARLVCNDSGITQLDVSGLTVLEFLSCKHFNWPTGLTHLDVSGCTALKALSCAWNRLTHLDVSSCVSLEILNCSDNELTSLDISKNTALTSLWCRNNQLTQLDLNFNTELNDLSCTDNQLTHLDISTNTALIQLECSYNQLNSLRNSNHNVFLYTLRLNYNELSADVINNLFETLHSDQSKPLPGYYDFGKNVDVMFNPGAENCDRSIAEKKGWKVYYIVENEESK